MTTTINLILFKVTIESFSRFVWFKNRTNRFEFILDFGYWTFYVHK